MLLEAVKRVLAEPFSVAGLDVGQINMGVSVIGIDGIIAEAYRGGNHFLTRYAIVSSVCSYIQPYMPALVVIEDYTMMKHSFTAFGMGEFGGMFRSVCWEAGYDILLCPVSLFRSFYGLMGVKGKEGKVLAAKWAESKLGFISDESDKLDIGNEVDAVLYAYIGMCFLHRMHNKDIIREGFGEKRESVLLKLESPRYYFRRDVDGVSTSSGEQID